ncbi:hypothetical protein K491DRAFT_28003 [Lophiostoma macrostomum CBS 122681]|uniref:Pyridoxamine 5'-phosphate oxidase N-terminal domain-containing protein n=1 Tax=Lophiostoma macrostomum CBS 122681 TaxID=1314788 RepID=A0A6A6SYQ3_9PLEO|nr:hypothetical protein K491DRAFT_28003 [Lophiostoma macrostomum CBS 122681]
MVKFFDSIDENLTEFMRGQSIFFVASAPLVGRHVNLSPKGHPKRSFAVLGGNQVAYLDATGSGCETIAHVYENGRVTVMFCSFGVSPKIMRLFCKGQVIEKDDERFEELRTRMSKVNGYDLDLAGIRAIILLDVFKAQTSCGFGVPLFSNQPSTSKHANDSEPGQSTFNRATMEFWATKMTQNNALLRYQKDSNFRSLDGVPGLRSARRARGQWILWNDLKAWLTRIGHQWVPLLMGVLMTIMVMASLYTTSLLDVRFGSPTHRR